MFDFLIKRKYVLIHIVLVIIIVIALFSIQSLKKNYQEEIGKSLRTVNNSVQSAYHLWVENLKNDIEEVTNDPIVVKLSEELLKCPSDSLSLANSEDQLKLRNYLKPHLNAFNYFGFFIISVKDYISYGSTRNANIGTRNLIAEAHPELFERVKKGEFIIVPPIISDVPLDSDNTFKKELTMFSGGPIKNSKGEIIAIFTFRINPYEEFSKIAKLGRIGFSGETYGIDLDGFMITQSRFDQSLEKIGLIQPNTKSILNLKIKDPGVNLFENPLPNQ